MSVMTKLCLLNITESKIRIVINRLTIHLEPNVETEIKIKAKDEKLLLNVLQTKTYENRITIL